MAEPPRRGSTQGDGDQMTAGGLLKVLLWFCGCVGVAFSALTGKGLGWRITQSPMHAVGLAIVAVLLASQPATFYITGGAWLVLGVVRNRLLYDRTAHSWFVGTPILNVLPHKPDTGRLLTAMLGAMAWLFCDGTVWQGLGLALGLGGICSIVMHAQINQRMTMLTQDDHDSLISAQVRAERLGL